MTIVLFCSRCLTVCVMRTCVWRGKSVFCYRKRSITLGIKSVKPEYIPTPIMWQSERIPNSSWCVPSPPDSKACIVLSSFHKDFFEDSSSTEFFTSQGCQFWVERCMWTVFCSVEMSYFSTSTRLPHANVLFVLETYASMQGLGAVLSQTQPDRKVHVCDA